MKCRQNRHFSSFSLQISNSYTEICQIVSAVTCFLESIRSLISLKLLIGNGNTTTKSSTDDRYQLWKSSPGYALSNLLSWNHCLSLCNFFSYWSLSIQPWIHYSLINILQAKETVEGESSEISEALRGTRSDAAAWEWIYISGFSILLKFELIKTIIY